MHLYAGPPHEMFDPSTGNKSAPPFNLRHQFVTLTLTDFYIAIIVEYSHKIVVNVD